jgi:hypothetical protein
MMEKTKKSPPVYCFYSDTFTSKKGHLMNERYHIGQLCTPSHNHRIIFTVSIEANGKPIHNKYGVNATTYTTGGVTTRPLGNGLSVEDARCLAIRHLMPYAGILRKKCGAVLISGCGRESLDKAINGKNR